MVRIYRQDSVAHVARVNSVLGYAIFAADTPLDLTGSQFAPAVAPVVILSTSIPCFVQTELVSSHPINGRYLSLTVPSLKQAADGTEEPVSVTLQLEGKWELDRVTTGTSGGSSASTMEAGTSTLLQVVIEQSVNVQKTHF